MRRCTVGSTASIAGRRSAFFARDESAWTRGGFVGKQWAMPSRHHLAYVFERFPTFTQTFCVREILELEAQGLRPMIFSIRDTRDEPLEDHFPSDLIARVHFLPPKEELRWRRRCSVSRKRRARCG